MLHFFGRVPYNGPFLRTHLKHFFKIVTKTGVVNPPPNVKNATFVSRLS